MVGILGDVHIHFSASTLKWRITANIRIYTNLYVITLCDWPCPDYMYNIYVHHEQPDTGLRHSMCSPKRTSDRARNSACSSCDRRSVCLCNLNVVVQSRGLMTQTPSSWNANGRPDKPLVQAELSNGETLLRRGFSYEPINLRSVCRHT